MRPVLAVGWDAGGWHGRKQAVAVAVVEGQGFQWRGRPALFSISELSELGGSAFDLFRIAWPEATDDLLETHRTVIAIDAPLGFPEMFSRVLKSHEALEIEAGSFYENPLAFRHTDRWVYQTFGKRPVSASFDKLGNNAVTAIVHARRWSRQHGFRMIPQSGPTSSNHAIIEVYPALVKRADSAERRCYERFERLLPTGLTSGTDQYDAAICAVLAASFGAGDEHSHANLPPLLPPAGGVSSATLSQEGWIYAAPAAWFDGE
jgi:hypothetical protein